MMESRLNIPAPPKEKTMGGSIRSNKDYINNMIGGLGSDLITAGAYLDGGGIGEEEQVLAAVPILPMPVCLLALLIASSPA